MNWNRQSKHERNLLRNFVLACEHENYRVTRGLKLWNSVRMSLGEVNGAGPRNAITSMGASFGV